MHTSPTRVWAALLSLYLLWGSTYLGIAYVVEEFPPLIAIGLRYVAAGLIIAAVIAIRRGPAAFRRPVAEYRRALLESVLLVSIGNGVLSFGEQYVPSGVAALLVAAMPVWVAVLRMATRDRPSLLSRIGITSGFAGVAVLALGGGEPVTGGDPFHRTLWSLLIIASAFSWAFGSFIGPQISATRDGAVATAVQMGVGGTVMALTGLATGERLTLADLTGASHQAWLGWAYLLVGGALIGHTTFVWLLAHARISLVATYAYVNPVVAVILGSVFRDEPLTLLVILGGTVVVAGVALVITGEQHRRNPAPMLNATD